MKKVFTFVPILLGLVLLTSCGNTRDDNKIDLGNSVNEISFSVNDKTYSFQKDMNIIDGLTEIRELYDLMEQPIFYDYTISEKLLRNNEQYFNGSGKIAFFNEEIRESNLCYDYQYEELVTNYKGSVYEFEMGCISSFNTISTTNVSEIGCSLYKKDGKYAAGAYLENSDNVKQLYEGEQPLSMSPDYEMYWLSVRLNESTFSTNYYPTCLLNFDQEVYGSFNGVNYNVLENTTYSLSLYENYVVLSYISKLPLNNRSLSLFNQNIHLKTDIYINTSTGFFDKMDINGDYMNRDYVAANLNIEGRMKKVTKEDIASYVNELMSKNQNLYK